MSTTQAERTDQFYSQLPVSTLPLSALIGQERLFAPVPAAWHVVLTDVKGSTQALSNGMHHLVNLVATGSIIAALNISRRAHIRIPFFFGGDGATLMVPDSIVRPVLKALKTHSENTHRNFELELRVGSVPIEDIYAQGHKLQIAKARITEAYVIPVVLGQGLQYAEKVIKGEGYTPSIAPAVEAALELDGMECRWDSIKPPEDSHEVICLLVTVRDVEHQAQVCSDVLKAIEDIYGPPQQRSPIAPERMRLKTTPDRIVREMRAKIGKFDLGYLLENWLRTLIGPLYMRHLKEGQDYLRSIAQLSDTIMLDGRVNTVIAGTVAQRNRLVEVLDRMEGDGNLRYGLRVCAESVMSCYVRDRADDHIHFVDGLGGGYTLAATVLKRKLAQG